MYDLPSRQLLCHSKFSSGGSSLLWAPLSVDPSATCLVIGFQDGVLRLVSHAFILAGGWGIGMY